MAAHCDPVREWREQYARRVLNIDFEPSPDAPFHASFELILENPRLVRAAFSPGLNYRDKALVSDGDDHFWLMIGQSRAIDVAHCNRDLRLCRSGATLIRVGETGSFRSSESFGFIGLMIPHSACDARGIRLAESVMRHIPKESEALRLLRSYIGAIERRRGPLSADEDATIHRHIIDLAVLAVTQHGPIGERPASAVAVARLSAALDRIDSCFHDPRLSLSGVAGSLGISPRYLRRLLEMAGTSFTERVSDLRLKRAFELLTESREHGRRISDIALEAGFSDVSHFNRLFRSRFGVTPSAVRAQKP